MKLILSGLFFLAPIFLLSQVGINTINPQSALDIQSSGKGDNIFTLRDSLGVFLFKVKENGQIHTKGVDDTSELALDLRSGNDGDIIAIGNSDLTHQQAGEGVIKYDSRTKSVFLSVDSGWYELNSRPLRVMVTVEPTEGSFFQPGEYKRLKNWNLISDSYGAADPETGLFTAPHDGLYGIYLNIAFERTTVDANSYIRTEFHASPTEEGGEDEISASLVTFPVASTQSPTVLTTNYFKLKAGQTLYAQVYNNTGSPLMVIHQYTYLSVVEF